MNNMNDITNTLNIDWGSIIRSLGTGTRIDFTKILPHVEPDSIAVNKEELTKIHDHLVSCNYNTDTIVWTNYYSDKNNFDESITIKLANYLNVNVIRAWISRIDPGYISGWHFDSDAEEEDFLKIGFPIRYSIVITENPESGHIFILRGDSGDVTYGNTPQGTVIKWDHYKNWHTGINAGITPTYMFQLLGYQK